MTPEQYRAKLAALGLTQGQASRLLGVGDRQGQRYATGESAVPQLVARVLTLATAHPSLLRWLDDLAGE